MDEVVCGDVVEVMKTLPKETFDLVVADPPYNLQLKHELYRQDGSRVEGVEEEWDKFSDFDVYDAFTQEYLCEAQKLLKSTGTIWVMGDYHNIYRVGKIMQDLGFWTLNEVVWEMANPTPNFLGTRFCAAHNTLIWAKKGEKYKGYHFNYQDMKAENGGKQMKSVWTFPLCRGKERLIGEDGKKLHPTQKPLALLKRLIAASTFEGDTVLDLFCGVATTSVAAKAQGRHYLAIDNNEMYCDASRERLKTI